MEITYLKPSLKRVTNIADFHSLYDPKSGFKEHLRLNINKPALSLNPSILAISGNTKIVSYYLGSYRTSEEHIRYNHRS